jgi:hypothetical protein
MLSSIPHESREAGRCICSGSRVSLTVERFPSKTVVTRAVVRLGKDVGDYASGLQSNYVRMPPLRLGKEDGLALKFRPARVPREGEIGGW